MKKRISALILCLVLCIAAIPTAFAANEESTITVSLAQLSPGYYLGAVWDGDELLSMFDYTVGPDGKLETTVGVGKVYPQGKELKVGISNANVGGTAIPPIVCTVGDSTPSTPSQPTNPGGSDKPTNPNQPMNPDGSDKPSAPDTSTTPGNSTNYMVYVPNVTGGRITVSQTLATAGTSIYITVYKNSNYKLRELYAINGWGQEISLYQQSSGSYVFTMPESPVNIRVSFDWIGSSVFYPGTVYYSVAPVATNSIPSYIGASQWHYTNNWIQNPAGAVSADTRLTRDMLLSILYHFDNQTTDNPTFWATKTGIIGDYWTAGLSGFDRAISQDQIAYLLFNYAGYRGCDTSARSNQSSRITNSCTQEAYNWANAVGLFGGTSSPGSYVTVEQAAMVLKNFFGILLY